MLIRKKNKEILIIVLLALLSLLIELLIFNGGLLFSGNMSSEIKTLSYKTFGEENQVIYQLDCDEMYVQKLMFTYETKSDFGFNIKGITKDKKGNLLEIDFGDSINNRLYESTTNINRRLTSIKIYFPSDIDCKINQIFINNRLEFNILRVLFVFSTLFLIAFLCYYKKAIETRIEIGVFVSVFICGMLIAVLSPVYAPFGWDDEYHYECSYSIFEGKHVEWSYGAKDFINRQIPYVNTIEERSNVAKLETNDIISIEENKVVGYQYWGYSFSGLLLIICRQLNISFAIAFVLGRLGNTLLFAFLSYYSVKIIPIGKRFMALLCLLPTVLFQSGMITRDVTVIGFSFLGISIFIDELINKEKRLSIQNAAIFIISISFACFTKAIYAPLLLLFLLLPKEKFDNSKKMYYFKAGILSLTVLLIYTFLIPAVSGAMQGDPRGGETDVTKQLLFVISNPLMYAKILLKSIWDTLGSFSFGIPATLNYAHLGLIKEPFGFIVIILACFVLLTDRNTINVNITNIQRIFVGVIVFAIVCFWWTALYLSFTPVGSTLINGVQGRYFIPLLPLSFTIFYNKNISANLNTMRYNIFLIACISLISLYNIYAMILVPFCR